MRITLGLLLAVSGMCVETLAAQNTNDAANDTPETHFAAAKAAAGEDFQNLLNFQCYGPGPGRPTRTSGGGRSRARWAWPRCWPRRRARRRAEAATGPVDVACRTGESL